MTRLVPSARLGERPMLTRSGPARQLLLAVRAAKGFGKAKPPPVRKGGADTGDGDKEGRKTGKRVRLQQGAVGPIPGQQQNQQQVGQQPQGAFAPDLLVPGAPTEEDDEFLARLAALKEQGRERAAGAAAAAAGAAAADGAAATPAIFDAAPTGAAAGSGASGAGGDIYSNPPPLAQTLLAAANGGADASGISDPKLRDANIGPSQLGLAAGAILFIAIFVIVAAGDYAPASKRYSGVRPAQAPPDPIEEKILRGKVSLYEEQLRADPNNDDATEALATSYAKLMQYDKAAGLLDKLTKRNPGDAEAWRLLGESSLLAAQPRQAVPAFERAVALRTQQGPPPPPLTQPDLQLLTGLVDSYIANNDYGKAVEALRGIREKLRAAAAAPPPAAPPAAAAAAVAAAPMLQAPPLTDAGDAAAAASASVAAATSSSSSESQEPGASPGSSEAVTTTDAAAAAESAAAASDASPAPAPSPSAAPSPSPSGGRPLDPVGVELLTAKVFAAWRGHEQDALGTYDELIKAFPEDYRGYLAKGVFLKERGRKADAERMFLQARFFAPASRQQLVRSIAESGPALQLPDNN